MRNLLKKLFGQTEEIKSDPIGNHVHIDKIGTNGGHNDFIWLYQQKYIIAIHVVGSIVALLSPVDVLTRSGVLLEFVNNINQVFPIVNNFSINSIFPEISKLYGALMVISLPYWLWVWFKWPYLENQIIYMLGMARTSFWKILIMPFVTIGSLFMVYFVLFVDLHLTEFKTIPFLSSRLALAIFGPVLYCWVPAGGLAIAFLTFNVFIRYLRSK